MYSQNRLENVFCLSNFKVPLLCVRHLYCVVFICTLVFLALRDGMYQLLTGEARVKALLWSQEARPPRLCWACFQWREHLNGSDSAQPGLTTEESSQVQQPPAGKLPGLHANRIEPCPSSVPSHWKPIDGGS